MNPHDWLTQWSGMFWPFLANHLWQATLFSALPVLAALALWRGSARGRHAAWLVAGLKFALPSAFFGWFAGSLGLNLSFGLSKPPAIAQLAQPVGYWWLADDTGGESAHNELLCLLTLIWLAGVGLILGFWIMRRLRFSRSVRTGAITASQRDKASLERARLRIGFFGPVDLVTASALTEPGVSGVFHPSILLPKGMSDGLTDQELDAVLLHELVHVKRRDNLVNNVYLFLCSIFWFHPLVWLIDRRLLSERERACDEAVLGLGTSTHVYAASLLKVLQFCLGRKTAGVSYASGSNLKRRIDQIMAGNSDKRVGFPQHLIVATLLVGLLLLSLVAGLTGRLTVADASNVTQSGRPRGGVPGGVSGGLSGGVPGGVSPGVPGGVSAGVPGGDSAGVPGGLSAGVPDGVPGSAAEDAGPEQDSIRSPQTLEALKNAPETAVEVQIPEGAPATITVAVARLAKVSDVRVEKITPGGATVIRRGPVHSVALKLNLQNNDHNLAIKGIVVDLRAPRKTSVYFDDVDPALEPRDSRTIELGPAPYYGDPNALVVRLSGLLFTDGTFWGKVPPPPPPPPPPPRPRDDQQTDEPGDPGKVAVSGPRNSVLKRVQPEFPPLARAAGVEGSVAVEVTIDEEGNVVEAQAWRGHPLLRDAAVAAAREWKFKPTLIQGKPVRVVGTLTFDFSL